jgi:1-phosphatidylinositol phosphodiesterase
MKKLVNGLLFATLVFLLFLPSHSDGYFRDSNFKATETVTFCLHNLLTYDIYVEVSEVANGDWQSENRPERLARSYVPGETFYQKMDMNMYRNTHPATFTIYRWDPTTKSKIEPAIDRWRMDDMNNLRPYHIEDMRSGFQNKIQVITSQFMGGVHASLVPKNIDLADWMKDMPDDTYISELTLPATHDSGTFHYSGAPSPWIVCQHRNFTETMNWGVRVFDIRLAPYKDDELTIVHSSYSTGLRLAGNFLTDAKNFLTDHPQETLLVELQRDDGDVNTVKNVLDKILNASPWKEMIFVPTSTTEFPQLKDVRGKIVLIYDGGIYDNRSKGYWLDYASDVSEQLVSHPNSPNLKWFVHSNWNASNYDMKIDHLNDYYRDLAKLNYADRTVMPVSSLNASHDGVKNPAYFASRLNPWGGGKFGELEASKRLGIVHTDFYAEPSDIDHMGFYADSSGKYNGIGYLLIARNYYQQKIDPL